MPNTQINLKQIQQSSAIAGDLIVFNGVNWGASSSVIDNNFFISDNVDSTKKALFQASGITANTTRTYNLPNANGTLALTSDLINGGIYAGSGTVPSAAVATITDTLTFSESSATTNAVIIPLIIDAKVSGGAGASGFGSGLLFTAESSTTENRELFGIESSWTNSSDASRTSSVAFRLTSSGSYSTRLTLTPNSLIPSGTFTFGNSTSDTTFGGSTGRAILSSTANSADAILLNVTQASNSNGITLLGANSYTNTSGNRIGVTTSGTFAPTSGNATWASQSITTTINQTGGANGITRAIHINPTLTAASDFRAIEISNTTAGSYGIHQSGASVINLLGGNTGIGGAPGSYKLYVSGSIRFDLGTNATGDIYYRNSVGDFTRLPIGSSGQVLTVSGGNIPSWATASGGSDGNGIYSGSGTIASAAIATLSSGSTFTINYNTAGSAAEFTDNVGVSFYGPNNSSIAVDDNGVGLVFGSKNIVLDADGVKTDAHIGINNGTIKLLSAASPTQITSNQNNYSASLTAGAIRLSSDASRNITGIIAPSTDGYIQGHVMVLQNIGSNNIVLKNEDTNSTSANRFAFGSDVTISANQSHTIIYDETSQRWRSLVTGAGSSGAIDHGSLTGLADDDHSQYALLAGRSSGQTLKGGTGIGDTLTLVGTSGNGTSTAAAVNINVGNNGGTRAITVLNNGNIGFGTTATNPTAPFVVEYNDNFYAGGINLTNTNTGTQALAGINIHHATAGSDQAVAQMAYAPTNYANPALGNVFMITTVERTIAPIRAPHIGIISCGNSTTNSGNVFVGTRSSGVHLIVRGGSGTDRGRIWVGTTGSQSSVTPAAKLHIVGEGTTTNITFKATSSSGTEIFNIIDDGRVGIGTASPNASAALDIVTTTRGLGIPTMTTTQRNAISSPREGLMIYDSSVDNVCVYVNSAWGRLAYKDQIVSSNTSGTSFTPNVDTHDMFIVTALASGTTFNAPTGTITNGQRLTIRIKDNGTARNLTWNAIYRVIGTTLPTATTANKTIYVHCIYNSQDTTWDVIMVNIEA